MPESLPYCVLTPIERRNFGLVVLLTGALLPSADAQEVIVEIVRVCRHGSTACRDLRGRTWILTADQEGTRTIPQGCPSITDGGQVTLPVQSSVVVGAGDPALHVTGNPQMLVDPGDRVAILSDNRRCCLTEGEDAIAACTGGVGQKEVWEISGPLK